MDDYSILVKLVPSIITVGVLFLIMYLFKRENTANGNTGKKSFVNRHIRCITVSAAIVTISGCIISSILDNDIAYQCFLIGPVLLVSIMLIAGSKAGRFVAALLVCFIVLGIYLSQSPAFRQAQGDLDVTLTPAVVEINGSFGEDILFEDIDALNMVDGLPAISLRTFGYSAVGVNRGRFRTKSGHTVWLYTYSPDGPAIKLVTHDGREFYINSRDSLRTKAIYNQIDSLVQTSKR